MKKVILIFMVFCLPIIANAEKYKVFIENTNTNEYKDSIINLRLDISDDLTYLSIILYNKSNDRIYIEWSGVKISGSNVAFVTDRTPKFEKSKEDELLIRNSTTVKTIRKRYNNMIPIVDKKSIKKSGLDFFSLTFPLKLTNGYHDVKIECKVKKNSGD